MAPNVYVTRQIPAQGLRLLEEEGYAVEVNPENRPLTHAELVARVRGRDAVLCLLTDTIDAAVVDAAAGCQVFSNLAVGHDNIDIEACRVRGIAVTHTPGVLTDATAEHAWALLFAAARRVVEADRFLRSGLWTGWGPLQFLGAEVTGATLGVVGAGRIGTSFALRSSGFGMRVLYTDPRRNTGLETKLRARRVALSSLLARSDFVSLHVPLAAGTRHLIGAPELARMKRSAILINTSRGPVVDEAALGEALAAGRLAGAGLDVYEHEPHVEPRLLGLANVVLCPHIASATHATRSRMAEIAARNLIAVLAGEEPPHRVV